jgi:hypothetical protein
VFPRRALLAGAVLLTAVVIAGCGKSNLRHARVVTDAGGTTRERVSPPKLRHRARLQPRSVGDTSVALPLALSAATAAEFARAVELTGADIPGGSPAAASQTPRGEEREAAKCGGPGARAIGGGRSAEYARGHGLDREQFSSSVQVLSSEAGVHRDLKYAQSRAGLRCYSTVVGRNVESEVQEHVRLLRVSVTAITVDVPGRQRASGIRIAARVGVPQSHLAVSLYSDALSLPYGPAELDLYATSFVQPAPVRTEQELLTLMRARARLSRL